MNSHIKSHYNNLLQQEKYSEALQFVRMHPEIVHNMTIEDVSDHYSRFRHHVHSDDLENFLITISNQIKGL